MPPVHAEVQVRPGVEGDLVALTDLYNHYVRETAVTFDTVPFTPAERRPWLLSHPVDGPHRLMVATDAASGRVLGYASSSPFWRHVSQVMSASSCRECGIFNRIAFAEYSRRSRCSSNRNTLR